MRMTEGKVDEFVAAVTPERRRRDAATLVALLTEVSGLEPRLWGTIIGVGACHYRYPTGTEGDMPLLAFSPRTAASTVYLTSGPEHYADRLARLGPHTASRGCLYIKDLAEVDLAVLREILERELSRVQNDEIPGMTLTRS